MMLLIYFASVLTVYVQGEGNQEMIEQGRVQYQLLKEKSTLPQYGTCWKSAVEHINEGCRHLSENTQSDIALHITNCFLEMSGHETYNCELDRKPNLRAICINSMPDRAFNVYTEFYTHTQNMCWFLLGQVWQEAIAENTLKVGRQLEVSVQNQEGLLLAQKESLELQEKILKHGKFLEEVLEGLYISSKAHQDILNILSQSISNLQTWIIGEVSWIDSIIFYTITIILTFILTTSERTQSARLPIFILFFLNLVIERLVCSSVTAIRDKENMHDLYSAIYNFIWYSRYGFVFFAMLILIYKAFIYKDLLAKNNEMLCSIQGQNNCILTILEDSKNYFNPNGACVKFINESNRKLEKKYSNTNIYKENTTLKENAYNSKIFFTPKKKLSPLSEIQNERYHLRSASKQGTSDF